MARVKFPSRFFLQYAVSPPMGRDVIYFLTPGPADSNDEAVRRPHEFADALAAEGLEATVVQADNATTASRLLLEHRAGAEDVLVVPDLYADMLTSVGADIPKISLNQNVRLSWGKVGNIVKHPYLRTPGLLGAICLSEYDRELLEFTFPRLDVQVVTPSAGDPAELSCGRYPRQRTICFFAGTGDRPSRLLAILGTLAARGELKDWELQRLDGMSHKQARECLRTSAVYLSFTAMQAMPTLELEAIIAGCVVVGSTSMPAEYCEHVAIADEQDPVGFAKLVGKALRNYNRDNERQRLKAASKWALAHYSYDREAAELRTAIAHFRPGLLAQAS